MEVEPLAITVLDVDSFSLVCTATVPRSVTAPKQFVWHRGSDAVLTDTAETSIIHIDLNDATSSSVLTVNASAQGLTSYTCDVTVESSQSSATATVTANGKCVWH